MNEAIALTPPNIVPNGLNDLLALVGLPSQRRSVKEVSSSAEEIIKGIGSFVDGLLLRAIAAQTEKEFIAIRDEVYGLYANAETFLAQMVRIVVPGSVIERIVSESFCEMEAEFREHGAARFGTAAKDQAMFTIWTLRRTSRLIAKIVLSEPLPSLSKKKDEGLATEFSKFTTWTQFHLDCLLVAIRNEKSVQLEVLPKIIDGLRAAVNAYGYSRQGLDLRFPREEPYIQPYQWDEEDQELLDASMRDMEAEALDD